MVVYVYISFFLIAYILFIYRYVNKYQMTQKLLGETYESFMSQFTILESWNLPPSLRIRAFFIGIYLVMDRIGYVLETWVSGLGSAMEK